MTVSEVFECPGCGKDMADYMAHEAHYADEQREGKTLDWPWTVDRPHPYRIGTVCPWTRDFLSAEWLRRHPQPWTYA